MAVAQLVSLFEEVNQDPFIKPMARSFLNHTLPSSSSSSRVRLHLQTIFSHNPLHRSTKSPHSTTMASPPTSSFRPSPSSSFSSLGARDPLPVNGFHSHSAVSPSLTASPVSSPSSFLRRKPSAIDLALEQEQHADGAEIIGLGLFEPRPRANTSSTISIIQCSMMEFMTESVQAPVVLDGIFEVMERA